MRNYAKATKITALISVFSMLVTIVLHHCWKTKEGEFWCNFALAFLGSALLSFATSIIGYLAEKKKTLEGYYFSACEILNEISKYDTHWDNEKKMDFFLKCKDMNLCLWQEQLGSIYFINDLSKKKINYIFSCIHEPIQNYMKKIAIHEFHFRWHLDGTGKNDDVMDLFVAEVERTFIGPKQNNYLVESVIGELDGRYHKLMLGKNE